MKSDGLLMKEAEEIERAIMERRPAADRALLCGLVMCLSVCIYSTVMLGYQAWQNETVAVLIWLMTLIVNGALVGFVRGAMGEKKIRYRQEDRLLAHMKLMAGVGDGSAHLICILNDEIHNLKKRPTYDDGEEWKKGG